MGGGGAAPGTQRGTGFMVWFVSDACPSLPRHTQRFKPSALPLSAIT
jgi:hypothetical protein